MHLEDIHIKLKLESAVNKILFNKNLIDKNLYEETSKKIDKLLFKKYEQ